jgi:hypothetical protein
MAFWLLITFLPVLASISFLALPTTGPPCFAIILLCLNGSALL